MYNPFGLENKNIFVTGASSGIGKAIAIECARMGAKMCITGRNTQRLNDTFRQLEGEGHIQITADLLNEESINLISGKLPALDGIVHCAGIVKPKPFNYLDREELDLIINTNFTGPVLLTINLVQKKLIKKNASVVFISSISGTYVSYIGGSAYNASKGAINGIIKGMALDLAPKGIRINSIVPGMIETGILREGTVDEESLKEDRKRYPLGRYGRPEEVAFAAVYLLSDASSWMTGTNLLLDGGYTLL